MITRSVPLFTFRAILDQVRLSAKRRAGNSGRIFLNRCQRVFAAFGDWASVSSFAPHNEILLHDQPERFDRFCHDCGDDTSHDGYDELGIGWYAQISRCRSCGRQGMRVWSLL
jgi:hypothetical protein